MTTPRRLMIASLGSLLLACTSSNTPPARTAEPLPEPVEAQTEPQPEKSPTTSQINISDEIRKACGLSFTETYFEYDSARVDAKARSILSKLAACFTSGPLAGDAMKLVGHADPRGDEEYNLVLGDRRASNVREILVDLGMQSGQISVTSRGEMDAQGHDEETWAKDRRVDVLKG